MADLPANADMTGSTVTQGQFKSRLNDVLSYLRDILGSTGTPAAARTALGLGGLAVRNDVGSAEIAAAAVTEAKLAANAVTEAKLAGSAVTLAKIAAAAQTALAVPVGTVLSVALGSAPDGYLKCNGAAVSRSTYAALFAAIGTTYGVGDGSTTFNLPDLRGEFVRGWDDGRGVDSGRGFGSHQMDAFQNITGTINSVWRGVTGGDVGALADSGAGGTSDRPATAGNGTRNIAFNASNSPGARTAAETRPRNVALLYVIKF